jgi:TRAP-type C4-dicarboxylate transport system permease small subunit
MRAGNSSSGAALRRAGDWIELLATGAGVLVFALMVVAVWLEVIYRYVLLDPLAWTDELAVYCMVWLAYLGVGVGFRHDEHPSLEFLVSRLPAGARTACRWMVNGGIFLFLAVATGYGFVYAFTSGQFRLSGSLGITMTLPMLSVPVGGVLAIVLLAIRLLQSRGAAGPAAR